MIAAIDGLHDALRSDFHLACLDLAEMRRLEAEEDIAVRRMAVAAARARIDAVLDMHLAASFRA